MIHEQIALAQSMRLLGRVTGHVESSLRGEARHMARHEAEHLARETRHALALETSRYAANNFGRAVMREIAPLLRIIDYIGGVRRTMGQPSDADMLQAVRLLQEHGHRIMPPGPPTVHIPAGAYDTEEPENVPRAGRGTHGKRSAAPKRRANTGAPPPPNTAAPAPPTTSIGPGRLPVGTMPGGLYVPMTLVHGSSNVYAIGYSEDTMTMRVEYLASTINVLSLTGRGHAGKGRVKGVLGKTVMRARHGPGPLYDYSGVPKDVFLRIYNAGSKGSAIWDELRVRGTVYGHQYDYKLVAAGRSDVMLPVMSFGGLTSGRRIGRVTYVPRKAVGPGHFKGRTIKQGANVFRSLLPTERP